MLGKIITSFIDMLHRDHDEIYVDSIVSSSKVISDGAFTVLDSSEHEITLAYESERNLVDFAEGLIAGCAEYFAQTVTIKRQNSPAFSAIFTVQLEPAHSPETTGGTAYE